MPVCSCPGCWADAVWRATATDAGAHTGRTFYTCDRHGQPDDDRAWIGEGEPPIEVSG